MEKKIKVMVKKPGEPFELKYLDNELDALQAEVGGYIETVRLFGHVLAVVNEEGKLMGMQPNFWLPGDVIAGTAVFVGEDGEDFRSLTEDEESRVVKFVYRTSNSELRRTK